VTVRRLPQPEAALSRRALLRALAASSAAAGLGGCASFAATSPRLDASALSEKPTLLVATTRKPVNGARAKPWYGSERGSTMSVARARFTPPDTGRFSLAAVGMSDWSLDSIEPVPGQIGALLAQATNGHDMLIYVHGFKQTFEAAALDAVRLSDGIRFRGDTMVFSWPSKAGLFDYTYDREKRRALDLWNARLLDIVAGKTDASNVVELARA